MSESKADGGGIGQGKQKVVRSLIDMTNGEVNNQITRKGGEKEKERENTTTTTNNQQQQQKKIAG